MDYDIEVTFANQQSGPVFTIDAVSDSIATISPSQLALVPYGQNETLYFMTKDENCFITNVNIDDT